MKAKGCQHEALPMTAPCLLSTAVPIISVLHDLVRSHVAPSVCMLWHPPQVHHPVELQHHYRTTSLSSSILLRESWATEQRYLAPYLFLLRETWLLLQFQLLENSTKFLCRKLLIKWGNFGASSLHQRLLRSCLVAVVIKHAVAEI